MYINAALLDFGNLSVNDFKNGIGVETRQNLFNTPNFANSLTNDKLRATVYALGRVMMKLENEHDRTVSIVNDAATDYDWNKGGRFIRNSFINAERVRTGLNDSHGFRVYYYGIGKLKY